VEVLDTISNPTSARDYDDDEEKASREGAAAFVPQRKETQARDLDFAAEEERVRDGEDSFQMGAGRTLATLDAERTRLDRIQAVRRPVDRMPPRLTRPRHPIHHTHRAFPLFSLCVLAQGCGAQGPSGG